MLDKHPSAPRQHACSIRISLIDCIRRWCGQFASNTKNRQRDSTASALMIRDDNRMMNQVSTSNPCKQSVTLSRSPPRQLRGRIRCPLRCEAVSTLRTFWLPPMRRLQGGFALPADRSLGFAGRLGEHPRVNSLRRSDQGLYVELFYTCTTRCVKDQEGPSISKWHRVEKALSPSRRRIGKALFTRSLAFRHFSSFSHKVATGSFPKQIFA